MNIQALALCALPMLTMVGPPCHAELNHPLYLRASEAYAHDQYAQARGYFKQYQAADASYLASHPSDNKAITDAISFCDRKLAPPAPSVRNQRKVESIEVAGKKSMVAREQLELSGKSRIQTDRRSRDGAGAAK